MAFALTVGRYRLVSLNFIGKKQDGDNLAPYGF
jgi:hypothetical protein